MSNYDFYVSHIRFIVGKTERSNDAVSNMMAGLSNFADQIDAGSEISIAGDSASSLGRGLAGVAGFLQQHILPEAVAADNKPAEHQVRWVIDTSMALMATLTVHADTRGNDENCSLKLPDPPEET